MSARADIVAILATPMSALALRATLARANKHCSLEALYTELVSMEADELVCVEPVCSKGQRIASVWALRELRHSSALQFAPVDRKTELLRVNRQAAMRQAPTPVGVLVHRIF